VESRSSRLPFDDEEVAFDGRTHDSLTNGGCERRLTCNLTRDMRFTRLRRLGALVVRVCPRRPRGRRGSGCVRRPTGDALDRLLRLSRRSTSTAPQLFRIQTNGDGLQQLTTGKLPATSPAFLSQRESDCIHPAGLRALHPQGRRERPAPAHLRQTRQLPRLVARRQAHRFHPGAPRPVAPARHGRIGRQAEAASPGNRPRAGQPGRRTARRSSPPLQGILSRSTRGPGRF
jgi:hypothetical protein